MISYKNNPEKVREELDDFSVFWALLDSCCYYPRVRYDDKEDIWWASCPICPNKIGGDTPLDMMLNWNGLMRGHDVWNRKNVRG